MSRPTRAEWEAEVLTEFERELRSRDQAIRDLKHSHRALHKRLDESERSLDVALAIKSKALRRVKIRTRKGKKQEGCPILVASDWHVEEIVEAKTVNGQNEYNPEIAKQRARAFFENGLRLIEQARQGVVIREAILALLGDMISGHIHPELVEANAMSPTEAIIYARDLIVSGIDFLLEHAKLDKLIIPCTWGNHGRTTQKPRVSTAGANSYEMLLYRWLAQHYSKERRVQFEIAGGAHIYFDVYDQTVRFHHGDHVRYQGGIGGLSIPLRKATDSWNHLQHADLTIIGHWHQFVDFGFALVNGSLIGYGPYALSIKARFEPPRQAFILYVEGRGKSLVAPIWVD